MLDSFLTKEAFVILHLFGVAIGAGGAFMSDVMFMNSIRDKKFSNTEVRFLQLASNTVWIGVIILLLSGIGIVASDPATYLSSSKFLAKMTIVGMITINGLVFHYSHFPLIRRHVNVSISTSHEFLRKRAYIVASGAISVVSWSSAIILGALRNVQWSYVHIISAYAAVLVAVVAISVLCKDFILPSTARRRDR
jgi:hypothetical protein